MLALSKNRQEVLHGLPHSPVNVKYLAMKLALASTCPLVIF
jgi:hypothetical protein